MTNEHEREEAALARKRTPRSLRSTLVEPFKQLKMGIWVLCISSAFIVVLCYLIASGLLDQYHQVMDIFKIVNPDTKWELVQNDVVSKIVLKIGIAVVVYMIILFSVVFSLTHKFYGPLVSIQRFVGSIVEGNYQARIAIRKGDELQSIVTQLNEMAEFLEKRHFTGKGDRRGESPRGRRDLDAEIESAKSSKPGNDEVS